MMGVMMTRSAIKQVVAANPGMYLGASWLGQRETP